MNQIDRLLSTVAWEEITWGKRAKDDSIPYATHEGWLEVQGVKLHCFQLSNGMRVIDEKSLNDLFGGGTHEREV